MTPAMAKMANEATLRSTCAEGLGALLAALAGDAGGEVGALVGLGEGALPDDGYDPVGGAAHDAGDQLVDEPAGDPGDEEDEEDHGGLGDQPVRCRCQPVVAGGVGDGPAEPVLRAHSGGVVVSEIIPAG